MARRLWFRRYAARIALASLFGAALVAGLLFAWVAYCLPTSRACGVMPIGPTAPLLGIAAILLLIGWGTLRDVLQITHGYRERLAHWVAGARDPRETISPFALGAAVVVAAVAFFAGDVVNSGVGFLFGGTVLVVGLALALLVRTLEVLADQRDRFEPARRTLAGGGQAIGLPSGRKGLPAPAEMGGLPDWRQPPALPLPPAPPRLLDSPSEAAASLAGPDQR